MRALVVHAHPSAASFNHALHLAACRALRGAGHVVDAIDLREEAFDPVMSALERAAYHGDEPILSEQVRRHAELVGRADALVFVYPTWWMGMPAQLKGWLERVLVPGVAFHLDERTHRVRSDLRHVRRVVGITTYGSPHRYVATMNDAGRRTLLRALRMLAAPRCRTTWLGLYALDTSTPEDRAAFLRRVEHRLARL